MLRIQRPNDKNASVGRSRSLAKDKLADSDASRRNHGVQGLGKQATVSIRRIEKWVAKFRKVDVKVDGEQVESLSNGEEKAFSVVPGQHSICVEAPWLASNVLEFSVAAGETVDLDYEDLSNVKYWALGGCGGLGAVLTGMFAAVGLPSVTPPIAGFLIAFGGHWLLEKLGLVSRTVTYKSEVRVRKVESS